MAVAKNKTRVQVTFGNEVLEKLDAFCSQTGMNRSSYITYAVAKSLDQYFELPPIARASIRAKAGLDEDEE